MPVVFLLLETFLTILCSTLAAKFSGGHDLEEQSAKKRKKENWITLQVMQSIAAHAEVN